MHRRLLLLVLVVSLAGCLDTGEPGVSESTTEPTASQSPPATDVPTTGVNTTRGVTTSFGYDCPYVVSVEPATEKQLNDTDRRRSYDDLSPTRQREFQQALENGTVEMATLPDVWRGPIIISFEGTNYYAVAATC